MQAFRLGYNNIEQWLKSRLWERKLRVRDLAELVGLNKATIYAWMKDTNRPDRTCVERVCAVLSNEPVFVGCRRIRVQVQPHEFESQFFRRAEGRPRKRSTYHDV